MDPSILNLSDSDIVNRTLADNNYFGYLIERYEGKLKRYIYRLGINNHEDQSDVMQEIFIKAYKNLNSFDTSLSFSSWIYRIAHNEAINWYRKQKVRPEGNQVINGDEVLKIISEKEDGAEIAFDKQINAHELTVALGKIDKKYRDVLILRYFEEKDYLEISDILKIPTGSVGTLVLRGKKQLYNVINHANLRI
jgi:RNA polymerase sigma-70 factor (ECF subfamily)